MCLIRQRTNQQDQKQDTAKQPNVFLIMVIRKNLLCKLHQTQAAQDAPYPASNLCRHLFSPFFYFPSDAVTMAIVRKNSILLDTMIFRSSPTPSATAATHSLSRLSPTGCTRAAIAL